MQATSEIYKALRSDPAARYEVKVYLDEEEYNENRIVSMSVHGSLFPGYDPGIGGVQSRSIDLVIRDYGEIETNAYIYPHIRLIKVDEDTGTVVQASEWLRKGIFKIDTREPNDEAGTLTIHGFDLMLYLDTFELGDGNFTLENSLPEAVARITSALGGLDSRTVLHDIGDIPGFSGRSTLRQFYSWVAASHGGNWTITDKGEWYLVPFPSAYDPTVLGSGTSAALLVGGVLIGVQDEYGKISGYHYLGGSATTRDTPPAFPGVSRVVLTSGDGDEKYAAGDETGYTITAECAFASDELSAAVLMSLEGYKYQPMTATKAIIDPAAELGDVVIINGAAATIAAMDTYFDSLMAADISAPGRVGVISEYPRPTAGASDSVLAKSKDYADSILSNYASGGTGGGGAVSEGALQVKIVSSLPSGWEKQNVLWVIPEGNVR